MDLKAHFPFFTWLWRIFTWAWRKLTGRWARRAYFAVLLLLMFVGVIVRLQSYLMARRIQAVVRGLSEIRLDQTTEEQMKRMVPYLTQKEWGAGGISHRGFFAHISNESDRSRVPGSLTAIGLEGPMSFEARLFDLLGYRVISFDAWILVQDGKVVHIEYGLADNWVRPQYPGYVGYTVSARSAHSFWIDPRMPAPVSSEDDESPQYRPSGDANQLDVIYTVDAPPALTQHVFQLDLSCFWGIQGCADAREIAPDVWQDLRLIREETYRQLISGRCPDSIVEGRMKYLPDITVLLLQVTGSRRIEVNEEGNKTEDWFTDYRLKEAIRGQAFGPWNNIRLRKTIPSVQYPPSEMANQIYPETKVGTPVLFFGGSGFFGASKFYSCRFIPATASNLEIVRNTPVPPKRPEDAIPWGLQ